MSSGRFGRNADTRGAESSPVESIGSKTLEMQLRLQSQQEELSQMQQEQAKLKEELFSQKVQISFCRYFTKCMFIDALSLYSHLTAPSLAKISIYDVLSFVTKTLKN